ncbi:TetR/AcrR family transcriptional regulator [Oceanobacillus halophilus]|uniref:TetR family transcriptional regulator n=1 Tax=Oceanobacillus halophilus TaxID=930130 RepID=A0A495A5Z3_9BACI|nr:TetR/AcrR family transcriptional regulator [Oceanobacillus halophilus]RKQ34710.1 TetR family transcriptional regulator [Oceanobacillus halophilus]
MGKRMELKGRAIQLFSEKGFHQTSVQEIADAVGISKGAFYKYFASKENLLIEILKQHYENMIKQANAMSNLDGVTKKEVFIKKLSMELEQWINNRDFFNVLFKDFPPNKNKEISRIMRQLRLSMLEIHKDTLLDTYGEDIKPFLTDIVIMLEGITKEYLVTIILKNKQKEMDVNKLATLIVSSFDAIVHSLPQMEPVFSDASIPSTNLKERLLNCLRIIEEKITKENVEKDKRLDTLQLLEEELLKEEPKTFLIEALINYLKQEKMIEEEVLMLERLYTQFTRKK